MTVLSKRLFSPRTVTWGRFATSLVGGGDTPAVGGSACGAALIGRHLPKRSLPRRSVTMLEPIRTAADIFARRPFPARRRFHARNRQTSANRRFAWESCP